MNLKEKQKFAKRWLDQNVHDGEEREDFQEVASFFPQELQELIFELLEDMEMEEEE